MPWIIFDEADRRIPAPSFKLNSSTGEVIQSTSFWERSNLVLFFVQALECQDCVDVLRSFSNKIAEYRAVDAEVLAIFSEPSEKLAANPALMDLPLKVLSDPNGAIRSNYTGLMVEGLATEADNLIFVLDQYGAPYVALIDPTLNDADLHRDVLSWLEFIGVQCPE